MQRDFSFLQTRMVMLWLAIHTEPNLTFSPAFITGARKIMAHSGAYCTCNVGKDTQGIERNVEFVFANRLWVCW